MAGIDNLVPFSQRSVEEVREISSRGGKSSVETRRKRKTMRESLKNILSCEVPKGSPLYGRLSEMKKIMGVEGEPTVQDMITLGMIQKASKSPKAAEFVRDTIGEKPVETFEDRTPQSPFVLGIIPQEMVAKAKAEHDARQLENDKQD